MSVIRTLRSLSLAAVLGTTIIGVAPASAEPMTEDCPDGWNQALPAGSMTLLCWDVMTAIPLVDPAYFFKLPQTNVTTAQGMNIVSECEYWAAGWPSNPNPPFHEITVADWLKCLRDSGQGNVFGAVNGTFFECTDDELCVSIYGDSSPLAYPTWQGDHLVNAGVMPNLNFPRVCLSWHGAAPPDVQDWTPITNDWNAVEDTMTSGECGEEDVPFRVVGMEWDNDLPGPLSDESVPENIRTDRNHRTYIGIDGEELCFLVGGWLLNDEMDDLFAEFGCQVAAQMDGGASSQFSYMDPQTGKQRNAVDGYFQYNGTNARTVPHIFVLRLG